MKSIIVTEIKAAILRHRLFDRLAGRTDIVAPHQLAPSLARQIPKFLVAGLDDRRDPGTGGWPVNTGARYAKLCFSPMLDQPSADIGITTPHRLPLSQGDYVDYVQTITGIGTGNAAELARLFRFDPVEIFDACREMRKSCLPAWRLLLSNEFALAQRLWPDLRSQPFGSLFRYPLVDAFRVVAEFERVTLIMRHLARARAILDRPQFLEALASPLPLAIWFTPGQLIEVYRWIEYATLSSAALNDLLFNRNEAQVGALPPGYAPWAIARGELPGAAADFHDHSEIRKAVARVFTRPPLVTTSAKPPVERRRPMLRNDEILRWYGMTGEVLPIIALDDVRTRYPTQSTGKTAKRSRHGVVGGSSWVVMTQLGSSMRKRADPAMQHKLVQSAIKYLEGSKFVAKREPTLEANAKLALDLALRYLPRHNQLGGAARFDPSAWKRPLRDVELWRMLLDSGRAMVHLRAHPASKQLKNVLIVMRRAYGPAFANLRWSPEVERVICDLACALSPITVDPRIAFAIHTLGKMPGLQQQLGTLLRRSGFSREG